MSPALHASPNSSHPDALHHTWRGYTRCFIQQDGRVIDHQDDHVSTSEGQAYALVRAAWMDDPMTFARVLIWTRQNLQGGDPTTLPASRWGQRADGGLGVLDPQSSSDADQWMAYALLLASDRWGIPAYRYQAVELLHQLWAQVVRHHPMTGWVLLPGPWATEHYPRRINPSHFLLFAWRRFAEADPAHPWGALLDNGYQILSTLMADGHLPPDWAEWNTRHRRWEATGPFGYEAFRLSWTLAADALWHSEPRARLLLSSMSALQGRWLSEGYLPAEQDVADHTGSGRDYPGLYGALLPAWGMSSPHNAATMFQVELAPRKSAQGWAEDGDFYGNVWTWMGVALWQGLARPAH